MLLRTDRKEGHTINSLVAGHELLVLGQEHRVWEGITTDENGACSGRTNKSILNPPLQREPLKPPEHAIEENV